MLDSDSSDREVRVGWGGAVGCETVAASPLDLATGNLPILATLATLLPCCHLQSRLATLESCQESTLTPI